ncbi:MAG: hypothetical protein U9N06_06190 [candidate division WOR-3 bacterium]|nr:hypothetical protein [candidate division WOR-3 bacterium]
MKFRRRFPKREYKPKTPIYLIIFFLIILGLILLLRSLEGG